MKARKKLLVLALALAMAFSCVACGNNGNAENNAGNTGNNGFCNYYAERPVQQLLPHYHKADRRSNEQNGGAY